MLSLSLFYKEGNRATCPRPIPLIKGKTIWLQSLKMSLLYYTNSLIVIYVKTKLEAFERLGKGKSHRYPHLLNSTFYLKVAIDNM